MTTSRHAAIQLHVLLTQWKEMLKGKLLTLQFNTD